MSDNPINPELWRDRAQKTRAKAASTWSDDAKARLNRIADEYDRIAAMVEGVKPRQDTEPAQ